MAFVLSSFKARARNWLRPHTFTVNINPPSGGGREIELRAEEVTLPGAAFASVDGHKPYGNGLTLTIPHTMNVQEISCVHNVDGDGDMLKRFYDWANSVVNLDGRDKFSANYLDSYTRTMSINIYNLRGQKVREYTLFDAFPLSYDQVQMTWSGSADIVKLSVNYRFRNYEVK